jgi:signal peptidase
MTAIAEHPAVALLVGHPDQKPAAGPRVDAGPAGRHRAPARPASRVVHRIVVKIASIIGSLLFVLTALILLGMTVGPRVFHYQTATMLTGSMVPTIRPGDVIVDVKEKATDLKVGQIITYHIPIDDHRVESHRVSWVGRDKDGTVEFRTKGDANQGEDPWTARATGVDVWRVSTVLPVAGTVIRFMRQPMVQMALTRALPVLLVGSILIAVWRRPTEADDAEETPAP